MSANAPEDGTDDGGGDREHFGRFEVRFAQRQLRVDGQVATLGSRAFDVLEALVRRRERIVTKDELLELVWPGVVVEENNLQVQVSTLRKLLGAQVITTIPGRGYRFTPPAADAAAGSVPRGAAAAASPRAGSAPAGAVPTAAMPERLLVVDDNKVNRLLIARMLEMQGHAVALAQNGREAMDLLRAGRIALMILDLEMPELDGFSVLEQLVAEPELREVPVIVASSLEGVPEMARCIELGADDFLRKPVNPVLLKARVRTSLEKKRLRDQQRALIERLAAGAAGSSPGGAAEPSPPTADACRVTATVLSLHLPGLPEHAATLPPTAALELVDSWQTLMIDAIVAQHGVVSQAGPASLLAVFGTPLRAPPPLEAPLAAARAALEMVETLALFNAERQAAGAPSLRLHIGLATGDVVAGYSGLPRRAAYTALGPAVDDAASCARQAEAAGEAVVIDDATQRRLAGRVATQPLPARRSRAVPGAAGWHTVQAG